MEHLDLDGPEEGPEKWFLISGIGKAMTLVAAEDGVPPETGAAVLLHYGSPGYGDTFRRWCQQQGIVKPGETGPQMGRESDYYKAMGRFYVKDWRGFNKSGQPVACSPDAVADACKRRGDFFRALCEAIGSEERFFGSNGTRPT